MGILDMLADAPNAPLLYTSPMENHPKLLEALAFDFTLMGCSPQTVAKVRHPGVFTSLPAIAGIKYPAVRIKRSFASQLAQMAFGIFSRAKFLRKPIASAGGRDIAFNDSRSGIGDHHYIQQYIRGMPLSGVFKTDGWGCRLLAITEQLIGDENFGGDQFRYTGSIAPIELTRKTREGFNHLGVMLAQRFDLRGVFGIDAVLDHRGRLWPVEINPRYNDSMEIVERAIGINILDDGPPQKPTHATQRRSAGRPANVFGKAVIHARRRFKTPDMADLLPETQMSDIPPEKTLIRQGEPICTIFAHGTSRNDCYDQLRQRAQTLYTHLEQ